MGDMMKSLQYLDLAKEVTGITSDYGMAKALGINRATISQWRSGKMFMDDYVCLRLAQMLKRDPLEVIAAVNADKEKDETRKAEWANLFAQVTGKLRPALTTATSSTASTSTDLEMQKAPAQKKARALQNWRRGWVSNHLNQVPDCPADPSKSSPS